MTPIKSVVLFAVILFGVTSCSPWQTASVHHPEPSVEMGQVGENEYELRIYDAGFSKWFARNAFPVNLHTPGYYEQLNSQYAAEWNRRAANIHFSLIQTPVQTPINYDPTIDYGVEIDYLLYNYFRYVEFRYGRLIKKPKYGPAPDGMETLTAASRE